MDGSFVLGSEPLGVHDPGSTLCGIDESLENGPGRIDSPAKSRSRANLWWTREWGMGKGLAVSLLLHAVIILIIVSSTGSVRQQPETITVFLMDTGSTGERGSPGEAQAPAAKRPTPPPWTRDSGSVRHEPVNPGAATPSTMEMVNETQTNKITPAGISTSSATLAEQPVAALTEDAAGGQGTAGRAGAGPGGAGSSGSGSSSSAGRGMAGSADGEEKEYLVNNFGYIRDLIVKNLKYPYTARQRGWKGSVTVAFVILENGSVETLRVIKSSGHDLLDESVVKTVRALQPFPRPPTRAEVVVPIAFRLE